MNSVMTKGPLLWTSNTRPSLVPGPGSQFKNQGHQIHLRLAQAQMHLGVDQAQPHMGIWVWTKRRHDYQDASRPGRGPDEFWMDA